MDNVRLEHRVVGLISYFAGLLSEAKAKDVVSIWVSNRNKTSYNMWMLSLVIVKRQDIEI